MGVLKWDRKFIQQLNNVFVFKEFRDWKKDLIEYHLKLVLFRQRTNKGYNVRCGNQKCRIEYTKHMHGVTMDDHFRKSINLGKVLNTWYICKGCRCVHYCSRKCQKVAWSRQ